MKIKTVQLINSVQSGALGRLAHAALPMRTALRLKEILASVDKAIKAYEDARIALCKEYGTFNEATNSYDLKPETAQEFEGKANALLDVDAEIPGEPFTPSSLTHSVTISTNDLMALDWLIQSAQAQTG